jgi:hypothetical protein
MQHHLLAIGFCLNWTFMLGQAQAQEMRPLMELMPDAGVQYAPSRCAGMYQAIMEWSGEERLGADTWQQADTVRERFIMLSVQLGQSLTGGTVEQQTKNVIRDVRNIADLYLERMERNYAIRGQAFGDDALIADDIGLCGALAGELH